MLKRLLNSYEKQTHKRLLGVCEENGANVFSKVRLADVLPIEKSGIPPAHYRFALQAHFDFVVTDAAHLPLFAVEFDGPSHHQATQQSRDQIKNALCERFEMPLLRINAKYLAPRYRDTDLLTWFVQVWFAQQWLTDAQEQGHIPMDEIFAPWAIMSVPGSKKNFPLWLSASVRNAIHGLFTDEKVLDLVPSQLIGRDELGNYHAVAFIRITKSTGVMVQSAMRCQSFPVAESDALDEIITHALHDKLLRALDGRTPAESKDAIEAYVDTFVRRFDMRRMSYSGGSFKIPERTTFRASTASET